MKQNNYTVIQSTKLLLGDSTLWSGWQTSFWLTDSSGRFIGEQSSWPQSPERRFPDFPLWSGEGCQGIKPAVALEQSHFFSGTLKDPFYPSCIQAFIHWGYSRLSSDKRSKRFLSPERICNHQLKLKCDKRERVLPANGKRSKFSRQGASPSYSCAGHIGLHVILCCTPYSLSHVSCLLSTTTTKIKAALRNDNLICFFFDDCGDLYWFWFMYLFRFITSAGWKVFALPPVMIKRSKSGQLNAGMWYSFATSKWIDINVLPCSDKSDLFPCLVMLFLSSGVQWNKCWKLHFPCVKFTSVLCFLANISEDIRAI